MNPLRTALVAVALLAPAVRADVITLTTTNPPGSPLVMAAGSTSGIMTARVTNTAAPAGTNMQGWAIDLLIVGDAGATGLTFASPTTGNPAHPPNYIFTTSFPPGIAVTNSGTQLFANDSDNNLAGTAVPQTPKTLLDVMFNATAGASGTFGIFAVHGSFNTSWSDQNGATQFFQGMPNDVAMTRIGDVRVNTVPEPGTLVLTGLAASAWLGCRKRYAKKAASSPL
jgi:hypothetical protein